ncbi:platelet glycoprotein Ib alpha chain [Paroedura picta]|uniref:platelet glycoprotein Ib alpha chain n=1 Tax=Paroedura picta TaxID=143630 RepID=UPI0040560305
MASPVALLALLALSGAHGQSKLCEYETNRIKDLLQASCEGQGLTQVPPGLHKDTGILLLGSNSLAQVSTAAFGTLRNLTDLDLSRNGLGALAASSPLPRLQDLDLSHNALKELPALQGFPGLLRLALGHNVLTWLPEGGFRALGRLVDLELQGNRLRSLPEGAFAGLAALKDLDLSDNRLAALPPELLAGLDALETLRLERNHLRSVPEGFFPEGHIYAYIYLAGNPWLCDCALEYLRNWIIDNRFSVYTRVQGPEEMITDNLPENVTCHDPPEELGYPVMNISLHCGPESDRGSRGDEGERVEPQAGPATPKAALTQPEPLPTTPAPPTSKVIAAPSPSPTTQGPLATSSPAARDAQAAPATSTLGLPPVSTAPARSPSTAAPSPSPTTQGPLATSSPAARDAEAVPATSTLGLPPVSTALARSPSTAAPSPSPTTQGPLATSPPAARDAQAAPATSTLGLPPTSKPATPGTAPSTPPQATNINQSMPVATATALVLPATLHPPMPPPPAHCQCPILPGVALGLTGLQPSPASWGAWLAARCCPLRLVLYLACLVLASVPALAAICWWVCVCSTGTRRLQATPPTLGPRLVPYQQLQNVAGERHHEPREGCQALPRRCIYRVCKQLEIAPLRYITWLLISLPGPSGQWPWERKGSLDQGKETLGAKRVKYAPATL